MNSERSHQPDIFLTGLLLVFITLKLTGTIDWSWWWVLAPMWLPLTVLLLGFLVFMAFANK